jgi:hypothetical protein
MGGISGGRTRVSDIGRRCVLPILAVSGAVLAFPLVLTRWHPRWALPSARDPEPACMPDGPPAAHRRWGPCVGRSPYRSSAIRSLID